MSKIFLTVLFLVTATTIVAQINIADSTVQVITYWDKGETQAYTVTMEKTKVRGTDTISSERTTYDVEITVLDETDDSYTIQWLYQNIKTDNPNPTVQKLMSITKDMKVIFKTDELGAFAEVVNWKEIKEYIQAATTMLKNDLKNTDEINQALKQLEVTFSTKEAIESASIKDIQQFHSFHGGKYKLGEVLEGEMKVPNVLGPDPFDADMTASLDEINEEDDTFILWATQKVNAEQLTNATFSYLTTIAKDIKIDLPKREDFTDLKNDTITTSKIHGTGWLIYSIQTTIVTSDNLTNIEERTIEIK